MKNIITISRQFGAGGSSIGRKVADRLGYYYCDKDMIIRAALESGTLTPQEVHYYDERVPAEFGIGQSLFDFYNRPLDERLFKAQSATDHFRIRRVQQDIPDLTDEMALEKIRSVDKTRRKYCKHYTNTEFGNGAYYDLSLKSSTFGLDTCVDLICSAAQ